MSYKFDEASLSKDNKETFEKISLEKINENIKSKITDWNEYTNFLYCPECHEPQLSLVINNQTEDYFLRTYRNQKHSDNCSYSFKGVEVEAFNTFLNEKNNTPFINNKLHNIIDRLLRNRILEFNPFIIRLNDNNIIFENIPREENPNRHNVRRIPTKSITAPFSDEDYGVYKLFYGNADVSLYKIHSKTHNEFFYSLKIYKKKTNTILCSLPMSSRVFSHWQSLYNLNLNNKIENV